MRKFRHRKSKESAQSYTTLCSKVLMTGLGGLIPECTTELLFSLALGGLQPHKQRAFLCPPLPTVGVLGVCGCVGVCARVSAGVQCIWLFCSPIDYRPPASSVHGISKARILAWVANSPSRGSSRPRDQAYASCISCIGRWILYHSTTWEAHPSVPV